MSVTLLVPTDKSDWVSGKVEILKEQWQLIIFVGEGSSTQISYGDIAGETKVYIGNQEMSPVLVSKINNVPIGDCISSIGYDNQSPGMISEFAIWNRALTTSQINGFWEETRYMKLTDTKLHIVNWGTRLNDVYHTDGAYMVEEADMGTCHTYHTRFLQVLIHFVIPAIKCIKIFLDADGYAHSQIIGVVLNRDGTWSQNVPCSACPGAQWPGCPKNNVIPSTTTYNVEPYAIVSKSLYVC